MDTLDGVMVGASVGGLLAWWLGSMPGCDCPINEKVGDSVQEVVGTTVTTAVGHVVSSGVGAFEGSLAEPPAMECVELVV